MRNTAYHHTNLLASQVLEEIKSIKISVRDEFLKKAENKENSPPISKNKVNSATHNANREIIQCLKILKDKDKKLRAKTATKQEKTLRTGSGPRKNTSKYIWSHGAYLHTSPDCMEEFREDGHKVDTTFTNKIWFHGIFHRELTQGKDYFDKLTTKINLFNNMISSIETINIITKGDSDTMNHYLRKEDRNCLKNDNNIQGPEVTQPNNESIQSDQQGQLLIN